MKRTFKELVKRGAFMGMALAVATAGSSCRSNEDEKSAAINMPTKT
jgi:hypothetical protein